MTVHVGNTLLNIKNAEVRWWNFWCGLHSFCTEWTEVLPYCLFQTFSYGRGGLKRCIPERYTLRKLLLGFKSGHKISVNNKHYTVHRRGWIATLCRCHTIPRTAGFAPRPRNKLFLSCCTYVWRQVSPHPDRAMQRGLSSFRYEGYL